MFKSQPRSRAILLLIACILFGLNGMFAQAYRNGWMDAASKILRSNDPSIFVLPGSQIPILERYTGFKPLDDLLMLAAVIFANVADGTCPQLSLYAIQFGGQLVPVFAVMMIEGLRVGNKKNVLFYSDLWGSAMQLFSYACIMPTFALVHIFGSAASSNDRESIRPRYLAPLDLKVIVPSFTIGYFLLCFLFAYPFSSGVVRQWCMSIWQAFPHFVILIQFLLIKLYSSSSLPSQRLQALSRRSEYEALSKVYQFAFIVAAVTQVFTLAVLFGVKFFPATFPLWATETLTFNKVFNPGPFYGTRPMESMSAAMQTWFLYDQYTGSAASLIWGSYLYLSSRKSEITWKDLGWLAWDIFRWCSVAGAGGALVRLLQRRDAAVLLDADDDEGKKTL